MKNRLSIKSFIAEVGDLAFFASRFFRELRPIQMEWSEWFNQCFRIGNLTLPLVAITGFIMGLVITIQSYPSMAAFGAESWLPSVVSVSLVREIVPVITAPCCNINGSYAGSN